MVKSVTCVDAQNNPLLEVDCNYQVHTATNPAGNSPTPQDTFYCALTEVLYHDSPVTPSNIAARAVYTYTGTQGAYNNNTTMSGQPPLLITADDPYFAGPMSRIRYQYRSFTDSGVWGVIAAEQNLATGENVSVLGQDQPNTPTYSVAYRGDSADSSKNPIYCTFRYGEANTATAPLRPRSLKTSAL